MKKGKDVFREFQESLKGFHGNLHVLDTTISVEDQLAYFKYSEDVRKNVSEESVDDQIEVLIHPDSTFEELKYALSYLAISGDVKAYRALENYNQQDKTQDKLLNNWVQLSLLQAKITLESELADEKAIFISTGLGGRGNLLRFYSFFKSSGFTPFSDYQRQMIEKEFLFSLHKYHGILENIEIKDNYFSLLFLIDFHVDLQKMLRDAVSECNQYGDFINTNFIVTNVKVFDEEDIQKELQKNE